MNDLTSLAKAATALKRAARGNSGLPALLMMTDEQRLPDPCPAAHALPAGSGIVLRHYDDPDRLALGRRLAAICRRRGLLLLVAGDPRLALRLGADGVHLPEHRAAACTTARRLGLAVITVAAHSETAVRRAARLGADAVLLSPVFATRSHPGAPTLGPWRFARLAGSSEIAVYALGGMTADTARRLKGSRAAGVAAIGALSDNTVMR